MTKRHTLPKLTRETATAYATRWQLVANAERNELHQTPMGHKFAQLAALFESARALNWETTDPAEVEIVRARWNRLWSLSQHG